MKTNTKIFFIAVIVVVVFFPLVSFSQDTINYDPISPVPGLTNQRTFTLEDFLNNLFLFSIGIAGLLSIVQFTWGGVMYMTSDVVGSKESAKEKMKSSVLGLLLILSTWIILNFINPDILSLKIGDSKTQNQPPSRPSGPVD